MYMYMYICVPYASVCICISVYVYMHVCVYVSTISEKLFILGLKYQLVICGFVELLL